MLHFRVCMFNAIKIKVPILESIYGQPSCQYGLNISYGPPLRLVPYQNLKPGHQAVNKSCYYMTVIQFAYDWLISVQEVLSTCDITLSLKLDPGRCPECDITLARHKNRWGKAGLLLSYQIRLLSYQIRSFVV